MARPLKILLILFVIFVIVVIAAFVALPYVAKHFANKYLEENFGADSKIEAVGFNPFAAELTVEGFNVQDPKGVWSASGKRLFVDLDITSITEGYPIVSMIELVEPVIYFELRKSGKAPAKNDVPKSWEEIVDDLNKSEIPEVVIEKLKIHNGQVEFVDTTTRQPFKQTIGPIDFAIDDLSTVGEDDSDFSFSAKTDNGATFIWEGQFRTNPLRSRGTLTLEQLVVDSFATYYTDFLQFDLKRAIAGFSFDYDLDLSSKDNLFTLSDGGIVLRDIDCVPRDDAEDLIFIEEINLSGARFEFPAMQLDVEEIRVQDGKTRVARSADGQVNLGQLLAVPEQGDVVEVDAEEVVPDPVIAEANTKREDELPEFGFAISSVVIERYDIRWVDALKNATADLAIKIERMEILNYTSDPAINFEVNADYVLGNGSRLNLSGDIRTAGPDLNLNIKFEDVPFELLTAYLQEYSEVDVAKGTFGFVGAFVYQQESQQSLAGELAFRGIDLAYEDSIQAQWDLLKLSNFTISINPLEIDIPSIDWQKPQIAYTPSEKVEADAEVVGEISAEVAEEPKDSVPVEIGQIKVNQGAFKLAETLSIDWADLQLDEMRYTTQPQTFALGSFQWSQPVIAIRSAGNRDSEEAPSQESDSSDPLPVRMGSISIDQGQMTYEDASGGDSIVFNLDPFSLKIDQFDSVENEPSNLELQASSGSSTIEIQGQIIPMDYRSLTDLNVTVSRLSLPPLSAYSVQSIGRKIDDGRFSLDASWQINEGQLQASNDIVIRNFELGEKVGEGLSIPVPLDLAIGALKGPDGIIDVSLPISGDLNDPTVKVSGIVWNAVIGLLGNVASAPFKMLGSLVGSEEDLSSIDFKPGDALLSASSKSRLEALSVGLQSRPELRLSIEPSLSDSDQTVLRDRELKNLLLGNPRSKDEAAFQERVTQAYRAEMQRRNTPDDRTSAETPAGLRTMLDTLLPTREVSGAAKSDLVAKRVQAIRNFLANNQGIPNERIDILPTRFGGDRSGVEFNLR